MRAARRSASRSTPRSASRASGIPRRSGSASSRRWRTSGRSSARWGWRPSTYVVLPIVGPSSIRDGVGLVPDAVLDPATYFFPAGPVAHLQRPGRLDRRVPPPRDEQLRPLRRRAPGVDPRARRAHRGARAGRASGRRHRRDADAPGGVPRPARSGLRRASRHAARCRCRSRGAMLPYSYRMQPGRAPIVFVVPGLGAHRLGTSSLALAEMAYVARLLGRDREQHAQLRVHRARRQRPGARPRAGRRARRARRARRHRARSRRRASRTASARASTSATRSAPSTASTSPPRRSRPGERAGALRPLRAARPAGAPDRRDGAPRRLLQRAAVGSRRQSAKPRSAASCCKR